jgi:hypothetical protein
MLVATLDVIKMHGALSYLLHPNEVLHCFAHHDVG